MARPKKQDDAAQAALPNAGSNVEARPSANAGGALAQAASGAHAGAEALEKLAGEIAAVPVSAEGGLADPGIEPAAALAAVLAAAPRVRHYRAAIEAELPKHPIRFVDHLETYAHAAHYAHLVHSYAGASPEAAKALVDEATKLFDGLLIAAEALAHRSLLDVDAVAKLRKGSGDLGRDLASLAALFKDSWGKVQSKTAVERTEVDRAQELAPAVAVAAAAAKFKDTDTGLQRSRAIALLVEAYDSVRQALSYLRWKEGDVDAIAPSLFRKRAGRKPGQPGKKEEPEATSEPAAS